MVKVTFTAADLVEQFKVDADTASRIMEVIDRSFRHEVMQDLDDMNLEGCFGLETVYCDGKFVCEYLNTGDTYSTTIAMRADGELCLTTWGDCYEEFEAVYCDENNLTRCGYCGEFTENKDDVDDDELKCENCGNLCWQ